MDSNKEVLTAEFFHVRVSRLTFFLFGVAIPLLSLPFWFLFLKFLLLLGAVCVSEMLGPFFLFSLPLYFVPFVWVSYFGEGFPALRLFEEKKGSWCGYVDCAGFWLERVSLLFFSMFFSIVFCVSLRLFQLWLLNDPQEMCSQERNFFFEALGESLFIFGLVVFLVYLFRMDGFFSLVEFDERARVLLKAARKNSEPFLSLIRENSNSRLKPLSATSYSVPAKIFDRLKKRYGPKVSFLLELQENVEQKKCDSLF